MNENDIIDHARFVIKDVMLEFLFDALDETTRAAMEMELAMRLIKDELEGVDFNVDVAIDGGSVKVVVDLHEVGVDGITRITATYEDTPTLNETKKTFKEDKSNIIAAYEKAMEIV